MLEQLYYTWSTIGYGAIPGFQLRAASAGLANIDGERYSSLRPFLNYDLPPGTDPYTATVAQSPLCLLFASTSQWRFVAQKIYIDKDDYDRPSIYFTHLVANLPETFVARDAIELWRATSFWQTSDKAMSKSLDLPQLSPDTFTTTKGTLSERDLIPVREYLPLLIQAYLSLREQQKIYIAAPADTVAALLWGLTHSLPRSMQRDLTFSTYESEVLKASMRIIGTCEAQTATLKGYIKAPKLLPPPCYSERGWVIDCYQKPSAPRTFVLPEIIDFSWYATKCLVEGRRARFNEEVLAIAERRQVKEAAELLFVLKLATSITDDKPLTRTELTGMLGNTELVMEFLRQEPLQRAILNFALADPQWWDSKARPPLLQLREAFDRSDNLPKREALALFGMQIASDLCTAMLKGEAPTAAVLMRMLCDVAPPDKEFKPWLTLLLRFREAMEQDKALRPTNTFSWEVRAWLLAQWAYGKDTDLIKDEFIRPWLQMNWREFLLFFPQQTAPSKWYQLAFTDLVIHSDAPIPKQVIELFYSQAYSRLLLGALQYLMRSPQTQPAALRCFQSLEASGYKDIVSLLAILLRAGAVACTPMDDFIRAAKLRPKEKIELIETHTAVLVTTISLDQDSPAVVDIITTYLATLTFDKLAGKSTALNKLGGFVGTSSPPVPVRAILTALYEQKEKLPGEVKSAIRDWLAISDSLMLPSGTPRLNLEESYLTRLSKAIQHLKLDTYKPYRDDLSSILFANINTQEDLQHVLNGFSPTLGSPLQVFQELATFIGERYTPQVRYEKLLPYVQEALTHAAGLTTPAGKTKYLNTILNPLLKHIERKSRTFSLIENEVYSMPSVCEEWKYFVGQKRQAPPSAPIQNVGHVVGNVVEAGGELLMGVNAFFNPLLQKQLKASARHDDPANSDGDAQKKAEQRERQDDQQLEERQGTVPFSDQQTIADVLPGLADLHNLQGDAHNQYHGGGLSEATIYPNNQIDPTAFSKDARGSALDENLAPSHSDGPPVQRQRPVATLEPQHQPINNAQSITVTINDGASISISAQEIKKVFALKDMYISLRKKELEEMHDSTWVEDEEHELLTLRSPADTEHILVNDVLIAQALKHYQKTKDVQRDQADLLEEAFNKVKGQKDYTALRGPYSDDEVRDALQVFVRYRTLVKFFQEEKQPISMREWLMKQTNLATIE